MRRTWAFFAAGLLLVALVHAHELALDVDAEEAVAFGVEADERSPGMLIIEKNHNFISGEKNGKEEKVVDHQEEETKKLMAKDKGAIHEQEKDLADYTKSEEDKKRERAEELAEAKKALVQQMAQKSQQTKEQNEAKDQKLYGESLKEENKKQAAAALQISKIKQAEQAEKDKLQKEHTKRMDKANEAGKKADAEEAKKQEKEKKKVEEAKHKVEAKAKQRAKEEADKRKQEQDAKHERTKKRQDEQKEKQTAQEQQAKARQARERSQKQDAERQRKREEREQKRRAEQKQKQVQQERNKKNEQRSKYFKPPQGGDIEIHRGRRIANSVPNTGQYTYTFWLLPEQIQPGWHNLFHKGNSNMERNPAMWFYPGQSRLHVRSGIRGSWNMGADPPDQLPLGRWTHVAVSHTNGRMRVYLNGNLRSSANIPAPLMNSGPLWVSDPWHDAAAATMADLRVYPRELSNSEVRDVMRNSRHP